MQSQVVRGIGEYGAGVSPEERCFSRRTETLESVSREREDSEDKRYERETKDEQKKQKKNKKKRCSRAVEKRREEK